MPEIIRLEPCLRSSDAAFARTALSGEGNCLVFFDTPWRRHGVEARAADVADRYGVVVLSVDVEECPELARRYQVTGVPSLLLFRNGQMLARRIGELSERDLEDWMESLLARE